MQFILNKPKENNTMDIRAKHVNEILNFAENTYTRDYLERVDDKTLEKIYDKYLDRMAELLWATL